MERDAERRPGGVHLLFSQRRPPGESFFVSGDDRLQMGVYASVAGLTVRCSGCFLSADGEMVQYALDVSPTSDRVVTTVQQVFGEGFLLSCVVSLVAGTAKRGQCYVRARIQRGGGATLIPLAALVAGYVTAGYSPSWPFGTRAEPLEGPGMIRDIIGTVPAAGGTFEEIVPVGARWRLLGMAATFTTSATVATRQVKFVVVGAAGYVWNFPAPSTQAASLTYLYTAYAGGIEYAVRANMVGLAFPATQPLIAGDAIRVEVTAMAGSDQWTAPELYVEEWIDA